MDRALRGLVRRRAAGRCEYCRIAETADPLYTFHVEHIIALQHGGETVADNLALSCHHCNLHKGPNLAGIDPETGTMVALFHPRHDVWADHFEENGGRVVGRTPAGRVTVYVLEMNVNERIELRSEA
jgi:hypothetical protein